MSDLRAWSFLTIDGTRQYGGNAGYLDEPARIYRYDSNVPNHLQVRRGDLVAIRNRSSVLGVARIEEIVTGTGEKERLRCPACGERNIRERPEASPRWRCRRGHLFDEPVRQRETVTTYEARYGSSFRATPGLAVEKVAAMVLRPSDQMSIKELDPVALELALGGEDPATTRLFETFAGALNLRDDSQQSAEGDGPSLIQARRRVLREIEARRGQSAFRRRLIRRYGFGCQVSGCSFQGLVEASHVDPYSANNDNSADNGVLLRSDLHTLFDLGCLGIRPDDLIIQLHPDALMHDYRNFDGNPLLLNGAPPPGRTRLERRWSLFQDRMRQPILP